MTSLRSAAFFLLATAALLLGQSTSEQIFDVKNGDQRGKLIVRDDALSFDSLTDAKHSRTWKYADIRTFEKRFRGFRVRPFEGDRYDFQFGRTSDRDKVFDLISSRIVAAREAKKK